MLVPRPRLGLGMQEAGYAEAFPALPQHNNPGQWPGRRQQLDRRDSWTPARGAQHPLTPRDAGEEGRPDCFGSCTYGPGEP